MANSTMTIREIFADRLRKAMDYREISIKELSEKSGCSESAIRSWLNASRSCPIEVPFNLAKALDIMPDYLLGENLFMEKKAMDVFHRIIDTIKASENGAQDIDSLIKITDELNPKQRSQYIEALKQIVEKAGLLTEKK